MSRYLSFASIFVLLLIVSCQKEMSYEQGKPSKGSLQDSTGDCLSKTIGGTYTATKVLADSNFIDVEVNVSQPGSYTIYTDTVNGYYFRASGTFGKTGSNAVRMKGFGTPGVAGTDDFFIFYDGTFCDVSITVIANTGSSGGSATYSLQDTTGNCLGSTPSGTFTQGVALTSSNKVDVQVNVTKVGTWSISTSSVAGFSFSGSGTFTTTGVQTITLTGSGTPTASGAQTFPVTVGNSSCGFDVTVAAGTTPPPSGDYFPLTQNSYWTYDDGAGGDTLKTTVSGTATKGGKTYQSFVTVFQAGPPNETQYYRKDNTTGFYYSYIDTASLTGYGLKFAQAGYDILFLKNSLATNNTWNSDINATLAGAPVVVRLKFTCANSNASLTANGVNYTNVYQITAVAQLGIAGNFTDISIPKESYYAKGIGLIEVSDGFSDDQVIRYYKVF